MKSYRIVSWLAAALLFAGCTEENPTEIGAPLVPPNALQTFEVILEPAQYLVFDTAFSGYMNAFESSLLAVARRFEGVTDAHTLVRYAGRPASIQVRDSAGVVRTDTLARFPSGQLVIVIDTARSRGIGVINVHRTAEAWDFTATWAARRDSAGVRFPWRTPGGTRGALVGRANYDRTRDSLFIPIDSAVIAAWSNAADSTRGALISIEPTNPTAGARLRIANTFLRVGGRSNIRPDTTVNVTLSPVVATFVFTPDPPTTAGTPRVSGVPAWRSILAFRDDFRELSVPCPGTNCTVKLKDAALNRAELLLRPTASPPGFSPEDSINVQARAVVEGVNIPLSRSPIADAVGNMQRAVPAASFTEANTTEVPVALSSLVNALMTDTTAVGSSERAPRRVALMTNPETVSVGFASFRAGPRLRLVLTIRSERR